MNCCVYCGFVSCTLLLLSLMLPLLLQQFHDTLAKLRSVQLLLLLVVVVMMVVVIVIARKEINSYLLLDRKGCSEHRIAIVPHTDCR